MTRDQFRLSLASADPRYAALFGLKATATKRRPDPSKPRVAKGVPP